jgi:hypothetical protein
MQRLGRFTKLATTATGYRHSHADGLTAVTQELMATLRQEGTGIRRFVSSFW